MYNYFFENGFTDFWKKENNLREKDISRKKGEGLN